MDKDPTNQDKNDEAHHKVLDKVCEHITDEVAAQIILGRKAHGLEPLTKNELEKEIRKRILAGIIAAEGKVPELWWN